MDGALETIGYRRLWAASEAQALGRGGIATMHGSASASFTCMSSSPNLYMRQRLTSTVRRDQPAAFAISRLGETPNLRVYSRLNWLELSYPTS